MPTYEEIMGLGGGADAAQSLTKRLVNFRKWLTADAKAVVHPAVCIVNGEATDGTKNAPVLVYEKTLVDAAEKASEGRIGVIDKDCSSLYDRTMGCQVRAVREIKKDEIMMELPRSSMVTPDLVASSDAGKAVLACCKESAAAAAEVGFWDAFQNTTIAESSFTHKVARNTGPQMLVKILQERKRAETIFKKASASETTTRPQFELVERGTVSTRAPFLAFLIHQRFSNTERAPVSTSTFGDSFSQSNALTSLKAAPIEFPPGAPETFSPYARTLPSSVSLPLCWKRNELALLAGCISGFPVLQEVAASTLQLVAEFAALVGAGILERFPETFPPGMITWERWVWAAAVFSSRNLPASCYVDKGTTESTFQPTEKLEYQSPPDIWSEIGVMVPLLDMLNHEVDEHQITWEPPVRANQSNGDAENSNGVTKPHPPRALVHKKIKKGSEIFCCYGNLTNSNLMLQYGFAQVNNSIDEVRLGWAISDAVGNVDPPFDYKPSYEVTSDSVFESHDESATNAWWTDDRFKLLEKEVFSKSDPAIIASIKAGKKTTTAAYRDGNYHPILLSAAVVATMQTKDLRNNLASGSKVVISKPHQQILQRYLQFTFTRKLEKLLQNLDNGLKGHFANVKLWTKVSEGGLNYQQKDDESEAGYIGWQSFFDAHAYKATMEVENRYYAMGSDSCVLAFYDSQLRALQESVDGVTDDVKFANGVLKELEDIGFEVSKGGKDDAKQEGNGAAPVANNSPNGSSGSKSPRNRRRNRKKNNTATTTATSGEKAPAIKLHVGNLSFDTTPSDLYDYFSSIYGQDNVLECHIPVERDSGRSRGFGFVAMPEAVALRALESGRKHEVANRILKVARSNSAGSASSAKPQQGPTPNVSDRCLTCGYRPRYCICSRPTIPGYKGPPPPAGPYGPPPPGPRRPPGGDYGPPPEFGRGPWDHERDRYRDDRRRDYYDDDRYRDYDRDRDRRYRYEDDYRRSYDRDDDYYWERSRRDRGRSRDRSDSRDSSRRREDDRSSSRRDRKVDPDDYDRRKRSRSRSKDKSSRRKKSKRRNRSRSRSASPAYGEK